MEKQLLEYLKADRQWPRELRIAHAKYMMAKYPERAGFFEQVIKANSLND